VTCLYRDRATQMVLEPLGLLTRLASLVPPPRVQGIRGHGGFAPHTVCPVR
jgi:hypothetical protein